MGAVVRVLVETVLDVVLVPAALGGVVSGCWLFGRPWMRGDVNPTNSTKEAQALRLGGALTVLSFVHATLMTYWGIQPGGQMIGVGVNFVFSIWHLATSIALILTHKYIDQAVGSAK